MRVDSQNGLFSRGRTQNSQFLCLDVFSEEQNLKKSLHFPPHPPKENLRNTLRGKQHLIDVTQGSAYAVALLVSPNVSRLGLRLWMRSGINGEEARCFCSFPRPRPVLRASVSRLVRSQPPFCAGRIVSCPSGVTRAEASGNQIPPAAGRRSPPAVSRVFPS